MKYCECGDIEEFIIGRIKPPARSLDEAIAHFPSGLMACERARYYNWMSREEREREFGDLMKNATSVDAEWLRSQSIFKLGNAVEDELADWLSMAGLLPSPDRRQFRIRSRKHLISGNIDFLIYWDGKDVPIECKSAKAEAFESRGGWYCKNCGEKLKKRNSTQCGGCMMTGPEVEYRWVYEGYDRKPSIDHYAQIQSYLNVGDFEYGFLYYYNKNTSERKWYRVEKDPEMWATILTQNEQLMEAVSKHLLPERPYKAKFDINGQILDSSDWRCRFCDWVRICWHDVISQNLTQREAEMTRLFGGVKKKTEIKMEILALLNRGEQHISDLFSNIQASPQSIEGAIGELLEGKKIVEARFNYFRRGVN